MPVARRIPYDLGGFIHSGGSIGRLMTLDRIPVLPGDTHAISLAGGIRLSPLRRNLVLDARVDLFAFYVPHRHVYANWVDFCLKGYDENETLASVTIPDGGRPALGTVAEGPVPRHVLVPYNQVWNRYFRHPSFEADVVPDDQMLGSAADGRFGRPCGHLPTLWSTPVDDQSDASADRRVPLDGGQLDVTKLEIQKAEYRGEVRRDYQTNRYTDWLRTTYGTGVNIDADRRPLLLMRESAWLSGYDVDGTSADALGNYGGKSSGIIGMRIPPRVFPERGTILIMCLVRFPPILEKGIHPEESRVNPTYLQEAGDPELIGAQPPRDLLLNEVQEGASATSVGKVPFGQEWRTGHNRVHPMFGDVLGHPFIRPTLSAYNARYIVDTFYNSIFRTTQLQHWQVYLRKNNPAKRFIPGVFSSIYSGAKK